MSIPKEPRQLMVNLMYLVLTAILALNVSAEILNAFITIDKSIGESNQVVEAANNQLIGDIRAQANAYEQYTYLKEKADSATSFTRIFIDSVENIRQQLLTLSGGLDEKGMPKGLKNKDVTTRYLVDQGRGDQLETEIQNLRNELLSLIDSNALRNQLSQSLNLKIEALPEDAETENWATFQFRQMPVAAVLPLLSKLQNDARLSETTLLNHFYSKMANTRKHDRYEAIVSADKSYVIRGEELNAEIFLGAYSSTTDNISITVDGRPLAVRNGKATLTARPTNTGQQSMDVVVRVRDPLSRQEETYRRQYKYEVGERSVAVSADKMNVFYVGVENPLSVSVAGVPSDQVSVRGEGVDPIRQANGKFMVKPKKAGRAKVIVSGGGLPPTTFDYRVKPIPTPKIILGNKSSRTLSPGEMKVYDKLYPKLENFDFETQCNILGFEIVRVAKNGNVQTNKNRGGKFTSQTKRITEAAKRGDVYYFEKIKVKCPGDKHNRDIDDLVFKIR